MCPSCKSVVCITQVTFQFKDVTPDITAIKSALTRAIEDTEADGGTPTPMSSTAASPALLNVDELEAGLCDLIANEKWSGVIAFVKLHRGQLSRECDSHEQEDDVTMIVDVYCKRFIKDHPGTVLVLFLGVFSETLVLHLLFRLFHYHKPRG